MRSLPRPGDAGHLGLTAEPALGADLARDARHLGRERPQLIDHRVDRVLHVEHFATHVGGDLAGEVAVGDGRGHLGDVAYLVGQVGDHVVDGVSEILPASGHVAHVRLPTEAPVGADLAGDARQLVGELGQLGHHVVDDQGAAAELTAIVRTAGRDDSGRQVAGDHRADDAGDRRAGRQEGLDGVVDRGRRRRQLARLVGRRHPRVGSAVATDARGEARHVAVEPIVLGERLVERVGQLGEWPRTPAQAGREVARAEPADHVHEPGQLGRRHRAAVLVDRIRAS